MLSTVAYRAAASPTKHGLSRLLEQLAPRQLDTLVFMGDYLDRGEDALATVEMLTKLAESCHCIFLRGNHDEAWLDTCLRSISSSSVMYACGRRWSASPLHRGARP